MAKTEEYLLSKEKIEELKAELRNLIDVERPANIEAIENARAMGDLSENADYDAAKNRQAAIEGRIDEIKHILATAKVQEDASVYRVLDLSLEEEFTVKLVSPIESDPISDPKNMKISKQSPLGVALVGHGVGEIVTVKAVKPYKVKILDITK